MTSDRKHPSAALWLTVALVAVLVGYPLSFGPWCWCTSRLATEARSVPTVYRPITLLAEMGSPAMDLLRWYASLCAPINWWLFWAPNGDGGNEWYWARVQPAPLS
jgi:hypothetical protein